MNIEDLNLICKIKFGSHLYGTETKDSDEDFKGIFLPDLDQILLSRMNKSCSFMSKKGEGKNTKDDIDIEIYSLHYFIKLACEGQTVAIDMLHAPKNMIVESNYIWNEIVKNKEKFYTKNLQAFVDYARRQASKYGIKGSRLNAAKEVIDFITTATKYFGGEEKLSEIWDNLPLGEHLYMIENNPNGLRQYQVCGKIIQETVSMNYALGILNKFYEEYGKRAKMAAENKGVDFKAVSHACRAAYQIREILTTKNIVFPLKQAKLLRDIKQGKLHYQKEVAPMLEDLMDEVEELTKTSDLPSKVDRKFWDKFIVETVKDYYGFEVYERDYKYER